MSDFAKDLLTSLEQATEIAKGKAKAASVTRYELADVKAIRAELNVIQKELAKAMDVSVDTIKSWEQADAILRGLQAKFLYC